MAGDRDHAEGFDGGGAAGGGGEERDAQAARRMLALALVLEGVDRKTAAETCGMDRQTLRDWVHRYNAEGLAGLTNRRGRPPAAAADAGAGGRARGLAGGRSRSGAGRRGALAAAGPAAADRGACSGWSCTSGRWASTWRRSATGGSRCARGTRRPIRRPRRLSKKLPRGGSRGASPRRRAASRSRSGSRTRRASASRARSPGSGRSAAPGRAAPRDTRYQWAYIFGAVCPARARHGRPRPALRRHRGDERHLAEIARAGRAGRPRRARARRRRLALARRSRRAGQHLPLHLPPYAARTEPGRERLAVPAPEQARHQRLRRLRRHRRRLLPRLEPLRRRPSRRLLHHLTAMGTGQC